jgi:hypothetical protein
MTEFEPLSESEFVWEVFALLTEQQILPEQYVVRRNANLYYQIMADNYLRIHANLNRPKRGDYAFQTDLCIFLKKKFVGKDIEVPKIVLEFKKNPSSHDVITYSNKARRHKRIYPYLRYGLVCYGIWAIPKRFFIHNEGLDFCLATAEEPKHWPDMLKRLIEEELQISNTLESTIFENKEFDFYRTNIEFKYFDL